MKLAVFSDVHGNLPALEAVYRHALLQQPDAIYCLGDLVNQNIWNNEVVEFIQEHHIPCVLGNHDEGIGNNKKRFPFSFGTPEEVQWGLEAIAYTLGQVTKENKKILSSFPLIRKIDTELSGGIYRVVLAHGSPKDNGDRIFRYYIPEQFVELMENESIHVLLIGNTHMAFHKVLEKKAKGGKKIYRHIINPGSVGCPKDGSWHACYAILNLDTGRDLLHCSDGISVEFFRLDYDIDKVIRAINHSALSIYYAGRLLKY